MLSKVAIVLAVFSVVYAGQEQPPPKVHTYNVNQVAKVQYPGPQVAKQVETYSAPSIEKTTTITRTITAPLNAPQGRTIAYAAPAPIVKAHAAPAIFAAPAYGAPAGYAAAPAAYAAYAHQPTAYQHQHPAQFQYGGYNAAYGAPAALAAAPVGYAGIATPFQGGFAGQPFQTVYSSPSLGYSLGGQVLAAAPLAYAGPAPVAAYAAAPVAAYGPPVAAYGAPAVAAPVKAGY